MIARRDRAGLQGLRGLFDAGTAAGLTDGQLLEQFATRDEASSQLAFTALFNGTARWFCAPVGRSCTTRMRPRTCSRRRFSSWHFGVGRSGCGTRWARGCTGSPIARRSCADRDARRRRAAERRAAERSRRLVEDPVRDDLANVLHEELDRLPDFCRVPLVLCDLEGRTYEEAARHMGCPVGTVKSRLARGRGRLRRRLTGRGLAPGVVVLGAAIADPARGASATFTEAAVRIATRHAAPMQGRPRQPRPYWPSKC